MLKIDIDLHNKNGCALVEARGTTPEILGELTMVIQTLHREGKGFTKELFDECIRLALQDDDEFKKEFKKENKKLLEELKKSLKELERLVGECDEKETSKDN